MSLTSSPRSRLPASGISLKGVEVRLGGTAALTGVDLKIAPGEKLAVVGSSGAGKTTLFRLLTRGVPLADGRAEVAGRDLYGLNGRELRTLRRGIGTIHQSYNLVPQLPAGLNAALGEVGGMGILGTLRTLLAGPDAGLGGRVADALGRVGLGDKGRVRAGDLSGGQQQRVAVARLLVQRPGLVLADEPFAAVDPVTTENVLGALLDLNGEGATLLVNLHDVGIARRFPRIVALKDGRVAYDGTPDGLSDAALAKIYEDDIWRRPERDGPGRRRPRDPVSIAEGRDGVSAH